MVESRKVFRAETEMQLSQNEQFNNKHINRQKLQPMTVESFQFQFWTRKRNRKIQNVNKTDNKQKNKIK